MLAHRNLSSSLLLSLQFHELCNELPAYYRPTRFKIESHFTGGNSLSLITVEAESNFSSVASQVKLDITKHQMAVTVASVHVRTLSVYE